MSVIVEKQRKSPMASSRFPLGFFVRDGLRAVPVFVLLRFVSRFGRRFFGLFRSSLRRRLLGLFGGRFLRLGRLGRDIVGVGGGAGWKG